MNHRMTGGENGQIKESAVTARATPMRRMLRGLSRLALGLGALALALFFGFALLVAHPGWAFAHEGGSERLRLHATSPLPPETAHWAARVMAELDAGPLPPDRGTYHLYVADHGWREWIFFLPVRGAGGVVYPFNRRASFLSGADPRADRLLKNGEVIPPPRTLSYFARHEITHLVQMAEMGLVPFLRAETWRREGVADYVALGPAGPDMAADIAKARAAGDRLPLMMKHGAYPEYRLRVSEALKETDLKSLLFAEGDK